ncbi:PilZ domain-containing protein [Alishewanella longhuensis]|nr:PilZ domain-containing protein [Alishewanella longhuensis]
MKLETKGIITLKNLETDSAFWQTFDLKLRLEVQLLINSGIRLRAEMVGYEKHQYLILRISPNEPALPNNMLTHKTGLICRFVVEAELGRVYAFKSEILHSTTHPFRLLVVRYPEIAQYISLRSDQRNPVKIPIKVQQLESGTFIAELQDLSLNGCLVKISAADPMIGRGELLTLELPAPLSAVNAMVKRSTRPDGQLRLGLQFEQAISLEMFSTLMQLNS